MPRKNGKQSVRGRVRDYAMTTGKVVTANMVAEAVGITGKEAASALASLVNAGVLARAGRGKYVDVTAQPTENIAPVALIGSDDSTQYFTGGDTPITTEAADDSDSEDRFIDWFSEQSGVDPDRVAVALAYYDMFVDNRVAR